MSPPIYTSQMTHKSCHKSQRNSYSIFVWLNGWRRILVIITIRDYCLWCRQRWAEADFFSVHPSWEYQPMMMYVLCRGAIACNVCRSLPKPISRKGRHNLGLDIEIKHKSVPKIYAIAQKTHWATP